MTIAALFLNAEPVTAKATVIEAEGVVTRCDYLVLGKVWPAGEMINMRGCMMVCNTAGTYLTGKNTKIINSEINAQMIAQTHGTFHLKTEERGDWECT